MVPKSRTGSPPLHHGRQCCRVCTLITNWVSAAPISWHPDFFFLWARGSLTVELAHCCIRLILSPWALIYIYMLSGLIITPQSSSYGAPQDSNHRARFSSFRISPMPHSKLLHICARAFLIAGKIGFSTQNIALIPLSIFSFELTAMPAVTTWHRSSRQASISYIISSVSTVLPSELKFVNLLRHPWLLAWPI